MYYCPYTVGPQWLPFHFIVLSSHLYTVNVVYIKGAECVILWLPIAGCCVLLRALPCVLCVCLTSVRTSVHGLQRVAIILYLYCQTLHNTIYYCSLNNRPSLQRLHVSSCTCAPSIDTTIIQYNYTHYYIYFIIKIIKFQDCLKHIIYIYILLLLLSSMIV